MKKIIACFAFVTFSTICAQEISHPKEPIRKEIVINEFNKPAEYQGNINGFRNEFMKLFRGEKIHAQGKVQSEALLTISEEGNVTDIKIVGDNPSMNKEMERVIKIMSKNKWTPALFDGKPIKSKFRLPIIMILEN